MRADQRFDLYASRWTVVVVGWKPAWQVRKGEEKGEKLFARGRDRVKGKSASRSRIISPLLPPLSSPAMQASGGGGGGFLPAKF